MAAASLPPGTLEQRLQLLIESVTDYGIFLLDPTGVIVSWNSGAQNLKGYRPEEIIGRHFSVFYSPEAIKSRWPQEELRLAKQLGRFEDEGWRLRKDGSRFWANVVITAMFTPDGELTGYAKITRDLTERRRQEEQLRISEERFRLLVNGVRDYAIFMLDAQGVVRSWNAGAQAIKGYTAEDAIGMHFGMFYPLQDRQSGKPQAELDAARANGRVEAEGWRVRKDGSLFWANVILSAVHDHHGALVGFAKVTRDMSDRRRLEELERSSRRMNEFLAMLAHELRNPLAPIRNAVTIMQLDTQASPAMRNCRDVIDRQLTHITRLVDDLLDVGRLTTGKIKLRKETLRLSDVVVRSVEAVRPVMTARRHSFTVEEPEQALLVHGDPTRLAQVLQNLLLNAAKYTPDGGAIALRVQAQENLAYISITDNGRGIAPENVGAIFDLFVQAETGPSSPVESGLGIGLSLARSLAEMHGGTIDATSPGLGQGSTFTLRLPTTADGALSPRQAAQAFDAAAQRVLVVDDNRDSADSASDVLRLLGHRVECAYDGEAALALAPRFQPDVVLLDLAMPGLDGFATRARLVAAGLTQAFYVAMTGYGNEEDKRRTDEAGFDAHVTKPVELEALMALLRKARKRAEPVQS